MFSFFQSGTFAPFDWFVIAQLFLLTHFIIKFQIYYLI